MSDTLTIPAPLLDFRADKALSPGMHAIVLRLGHEIDRARFPAEVRDAVWFTLPACELRNGDDNFWLRKCLDRLTGVKLAGEHRETAWGAVLIAEWRIEGAGAVVRVLVPPAAINALRAPETFAKVETECLNRLTGAARSLYLALADKKRLGQAHWDFELPELRELLGVGDRKSYLRWDNFRRWVLGPALAQVNDLGTVKVTMRPVKAGRVVWSVRFAWRWKSLDEAREAAAEADRPKGARGKPRDDGVRDAPPLMVADRVAVPAPIDPRPREERVPVPEVREFLASRS